MRKDTIPDLTDIVSEGRNQSYGYYRIRKKYNKTLLLSFILSIGVLLMMVVIPLMTFYFGDNSLPDPDEMVNVEYAFIPPPEDMPLVPPGEPPAPAPAEEPVKPPVVVDSVPVQKPIEEKDTESPEESTDTANSGKGNGLNGEDGEGIFTSLDVYPRYPGGEQARLSFLRYNIRYPQSAMKSLVQGVVKVVFVVESDGSLSHFEIAKGVGSGCDEEALRVVKMMPRWEPGRRHGKNVRVLISMPIVFRLPVKPK